jgi:transcriptional regulator with XRE-family HTH domain
MKNRLRELRVAANLTQTELARRSGLPLATVNRIDQNSRAKVELRVATLLAGALRVNVTDLLPTRP